MVKPERDPSTWTPEASGGAPGTRRARAAADRASHAATDPRAEIDARLEALLGEFAPGGIGEAMAWALLGGGKRLRPRLVRAAYEACGGERPGVALDAGCAVECVHTYSLVHDDLPCMDDDDLRRGRATVHRRFDEATAVLAGDALLAMGFEVLASLAGAPHGVPADRVAEAVARLARAAGARDLVEGQRRDLAAEPAGDPAAIEALHERKTGALIGASLAIGATLAGADASAREAFDAAGRRAGVAFQIVDDVLDATGEAATLGKTPGRDAEHGRASYVAAVGVEAARARARELIGEAHRALPATSPALDALLEQLVERRA